MSVRRIKSYSAETGYVYQYYFESVRPGQRRDGEKGDEYVFVVSRDRKTNFEIPVLLTEEALQHWSREHSRTLAGPEQFAAVKMRLFAAFDVIEEMERDRLTITVTPENISGLLEQLEIE